MAAVNALSTVDWAEVIDATSPDWTLARMAAKSESVSDFRVLIAPRTIEVKPADATTLA
jgi:hypothetical protein